MKNKKPKIYGLHNFEKIEQVQKYLSTEQIEAIKVVGQILPFKTNNYVIENLINWENVPNDPLFILNFPQKEMLKPEHYYKIQKALNEGLSYDEIQKIANEIRIELNPHPAGQKEKNVPMLNGKRLEGIQHKYRETILAFPVYGQSCHAHCTFCFRWPQFVNMPGQQFALEEADLMVNYLKQHTEVTDVLFTGGDSLFMTAEQLKIYVNAILDANLSHIQTIRFGTKTLSYWPYRFTSQFDAEETLQLFKDIVNSGHQLAFMAHFNHPAELKTEAVKEAIKKIRATGAEIRAQAPIMKNINDKAEIWRDLWKEEVKLGIIPYYMFIARDTGAQEYFSIPLERTWQIFRKAYQQVSGIARTVRGPVMSSNPGKVQILGTITINNEKYFNLRFIQGRNPDWVHQPFFAQYDKNAIWLDELKPAFSEEFFFDK